MKAQNLSFWENVLFMLIIITGVFLFASIFGARGTLYWMVQIILQLMVCAISFYLTFNTTRSKVVSVGFLLIGVISAADILVILFNYLV